MAFNSSIEPYYIGVCALIFCGATMSLFTLNSKYTKFEDAVKGQVDEQSDVTVSYDANVYPEEELKEISGAAVIMEIMDQDGSIPIRVNNECLNNIDNINGSGYDFFTYMRESGTDYLAEKVSITASYQKKITVDQDGHITEVNYVVN